MIILWNILVTLLQNGRQLPKISNIIDLILKKMEK